MHEHDQRDSAVVCIAAAQVSQSRIKPCLVVLLDDPRKVGFLNINVKTGRAERLTGIRTLAPGLIIFLFDINLKWTVEPVSCSKKDGSKASVQPMSTSRGSLRRSLLRRLSAIHSPNTSEMTCTLFSQAGGASPSLPGSRSFVRSLYSALNSACQRA